jgi:hypothetical protein
MQPALVYAISAIIGTATADTTIAAENVIMASLNRHGMRLVQCLAF